MRFCLLACALAACTQHVDEPSDPENAPPEAVLGELSLGQGQTRSAAVEFSDPDGDAIASVVVQSTHAGLEASYDTELLLHAGYDPSGPTNITLTVSDERGASSDISHPVDVKPIGWRGATSWSDAQGPEAREHGAMVVDGAGRYALILGGSGYDPYLEPLGDAWRYDLDARTWSQVTPTGEVLPPGGSRRVASVPGTSSAYLFGGYGEGTAEFDDLFLLEHADGQAVLTSVAQVGAPPARALHAFVYDPVTDRFFVFGGVAQGIFDDTWSMQLVDGVAQWTQLDLAVKPSKRYGFFYGFDAELGRLIVYSGAQGLATVNPASDTWALDVRSDPPAWQLVQDGTAAPQGRRNGCMVFDPSGPRLWVFGGTPDAMTTAPGLWAFDARPGHESWAEVVREGEPPLRSSGFGGYDELSDQVLLGFGNSSTGVYRDLNAVGY